MDNKAHPLPTPDSISTIDESDPPNYDDLESTASTVTTRAAADATGRLDDSCNDLLANIGR